jgi:hypothetical protein
MEKSLKEYVEWYVTQGFNLIPVKYSAKEPLIKWKSYQIRHISRQEIEQYFFSSPYINVAVVCGKTSGNLVIIDFDKPEVYKKIFPNIEKETLVVRSSKGFHVYFRTENPINSFRIRELSIDVQGQGTYVLAPPSLHPSGKNYEFVSQKTVAKWSGDFKTEFLDILERKFKGKFARKREEVNITRLLAGVEEGYRDEAAIRIASWFRQKGLSPEKVLEKLKEWNKKNDPLLDEDTLQIKVESAFRPEKPYGYKFIETEEEYFSKNEVEQARKLLKSPDILWRLHEANRDIIREDKNRILIPVLEFGKASFEITGESASGKNTIVDRSLLCVPSSWYEKITGLSDKTIRYLPDSIRTLYIAERRGLRTGEESTAEYDVKVSISEGKLRVRVPIRKKEGERYVSELIETTVENFIMTSTEFAPPSELENRIYNLCSDETVRQNELVRDTQLEERAKLPSERIETSSEKKIFRCAFDILDKEAPKECVIPYAPYLKSLLPPTNVSIRRHTPKLLDLIENVARIYYLHLPVVDDNGTSVVVATPEIFLLAWRIGDEAITGAIRDLTQKQTTIWKEVEGLLDDHDEITSTDLAERIGKSTSTARRALNTFERKGFLIKDQTARPYKFRKAQKESVLLNVPTLSIADLRTATENLVRRVFAKKSQEDIDQILVASSRILIDPLSGEPISPSEFLADSNQTSETTTVAEKEPDGNGTQEKLQITQPDNFLQMILGGKKRKATERVK